MTRKVGRIALKNEPQPLIDPALDQDKINGSMAAMRVDALAERQAHDTGIFDLGRRVGAIQMARVQREFLAVASIRLFEEIRESNKYKDLALPGPNGELATARNLEEFCSRVFGSGYAQMMDASKDLNALGDASYEAANRLGLNRRQLRLIRTLPDDQREAVQLALQSESKAEVVAVIEDMAAKLAETNAALAEEKAEREADKSLLDTKNKKIDQLQREVRRIAKLPPDEALAVTMKEATAITLDALGAIRGGVRHALIAIKNISDDDQSVLMAGLLGQLQAELTLIREEFNLPDVSSAADQQLAAEVAQWAN